MTILHILSRTDNEYSYISVARSAVGSSITILTGTDLNNQQLVTLFRRDVFYTRPSLSRYKENFVCTNYFTANISGKLFVNPTRGSKDKERTQKSSHTMFNLKL